MGIERNISYELPDHLEAAGHRLETIRRARNALIEQAHVNEYPFSVLITGSTSYGYNSLNQGRLDDLDCIGIIPDHYLDDDMLNRVEFDQLDRPNHRELGKFLADHYKSPKHPNLIRISGNLENIKTSIYLAKQSTIQNGINDPHYSLKLLAPSSHHRLFALNSRFEILGTGQSVVHDPDIESYQSNSDKVLVPECIFKEVSVDGQNVYIKGALADKLLISQIGYTRNPYDIDQLLDDVWQKFITLSKAQNQNITARGIISTIIKSPYFSEDFRDTLENKVTTILDKRYE